MFPNCVFDKVNSNCDGNSKKRFSIITFQEPRSKIRQVKYEREKFALLSREMATMSVGAVASDSGSGSGNPDPLDTPPGEGGGGRKESTELYPEIIHQIIP